MRKAPEREVRQSKGLRVQDEGEVLSGLGRTADETGWPDEGYC